METAQEWMDEIDAAAERYKRAEAWKMFCRWWLRFVVIVCLTVGSAWLCGWGLAKVWPN